MHIDKDLVAASATPLVLAILAEGESYGYAILKRVREVSGGELVVQAFDVGRPAVEEHRLAARVDRPARRGEHEPRTRAVVRVAGP